MVLSILLIIQSFNSFIPVKALDTGSTVMDLVIDDQQGSLSFDYSIDKIDRFNQFGVAIIRDDTVLEDGLIQTKFGLMSSRGEILLEPIYDEITSYDQNNTYFLVSKMTSNGNWVNYQQGLYSQKPNAQGQLDVILPVKYNWIPSIENKTILELGYISDQETNQWKNEILSINPTTHTIEPISTPSGINQSDYDYIWLEDTNQDFKMMYLSRSTQEGGWESKSWLVDKYGNTLSGFSNVYDWIDVRRSRNGNLFALVQKYNTTLNKYQSGLYKINISNTHQVSVTAIFDEEDYENVWYNQQDDYVQVNFRTSNGYWVSKQYSLETESFLEGNADQGQQNDNLFWQNEDFSIVQSCSYSESSNNYSCLGYLYKTGDSTKTNIFGTNKTYNNIYAPNENFVIVSNGSNNNQTSNVLVKKIVNNVATYFMLFDQDVTGYISINSSDWLTIYNSNDNPQFDLTNVQGQTSLTALKLTDAYVNNGYQSYTWYDRFQYFTKVLSNGQNSTPYVALYKLYDLKTKSYILSNVYNLNLSITPDGNYYGSYNTVMSNDYTERSGFNSFLYDVSSSTPQFHSYPNANYIGQFNSNKFAKIYYNGLNKTGYIDSHGTFKINPVVDGNTYINNIREYTKYDGENDLVIATSVNSINNSYSNNLYVIDGNSNNADASKYIPNINDAICYNTDYPTLISYTLNGSLQYGYFKNGVIYDSVQETSTAQYLPFLSGVNQASGFANGISLIKSNAGVYAVFPDLSVSERISRTVNNTIEAATNINGNIVSYSDAYKFLYKNSGNDIIQIDIPSTITEKIVGLSSFYHFYENIYKYEYSIDGTPYNGLMYFDLSSSTPTLVDLGAYTNLYQQTDTNGVNLVQYNGYGNAHGVLLTDGSFQLRDDSGQYQYYQEGSLLRINTLDGKSTLMDFNKNYILTNGSGQPKYYDWIYSESNDHTFYRMQETVNGNAVYSSMFVRNGNIELYPGVQADAIQNTDLIRLQKRIDSNNYVYGLIRKDGKVIVPFDEANPISQLDVNTKYGVIIPKKKVFTENGFNWVNDAIYDLYGNVITQLNGYSAINNIDSKGNLEVLKQTDYRRQWNGGFEDIYTRNIYNFETRSFVYAEDYYFSQTYPKFKIVRSLGDLEHAELYDSRNGGDYFLKRTNGVWGTTKYKFSFTQSVINSDGVTVIAPGSFTNINNYDDYFIVSKNVQENGYTNYVAGVLDEFGYPVVCADYAKNGNEYILDSNGNKTIDLTCNGVDYNKKANRFTFYETKRVETPESWESLDPYYTIYIYSYYDLLTKQVVRNGYTNYNERTLNQKGYTIVEVFDNFLDDNPNNNTIDAVTAETPRKYGILNQDGTYMVEPKYTYLKDFNTNGYIQLIIDKGNYDCDWYDNDGNLQQGTCWDSVRGIYSKSDGMILEPKYEFILSTFPSRTSGDEVPQFDKRGLLSLIQRYGSRETGIYRVGLADKKGELFGGAIYEFAYYLNGEFYLKLPNEDWMIINDDAITDDQMRGSAWTSYLQTYASSIERVEFNYENTQDSWMNTIERVEVETPSLLGNQVENYFIVKTQRYDADFNKNYDYYGVVKQDGSIYLDFDYTMITYDTVTKTWHLELYNPLFGTEQKGVMAQDKTFIVPFNNKYDSIGDYVDGFAIGTSGQAPATPQETSAVPFVDILFSAFFLPVHAAEPESDFVLEIIDENGNVVGDLSQEYESAVLLGAVGENGEVKALVKKDGQYFIATLTQVPFTGEKITAVEIDRTSVSLTVGDSTKLFSEIFPLTSTQPKTITWSSSDDSVVSVDGKGNIKALKAGTATITLKVNQFTGTSTITVKETSTISTETVVSTIVTAIETKEASKVTSTFSTKIETFVKALDGTTKLSDSEFKSVLKDLVTKDDQFVSYLSDNQAKALEDRLLDLYKDTLSIKPINANIPVKIEGLVLQLDLARLLSGKKIDVSVDIQTVIPEVDLEATKTYLSDHLMDSTLMYSLNIVVNQTIDGKESNLSLLSKPITLTFELPKTFIGVGDLQVIRIHEGVADSLNVTLNADFTFSFNTDRLSSFTLVKKQEMKRIDEPTQDTVLPASSSFPVWPLVGGLSVLVVGSTLYIVRKRNKRLS